MDALKQKVKQCLAERTTTTTGNFSMANRICRLCFEIGRLCLCSESGPDLKLKGTDEVSDPVAVLLSSTSISLLVPGFHKPPAPDPPPLFAIVVTNLKSR